MTHLLTKRVVCLIDQNRDALVDVSNAKLINIEGTQNNSGGCTSNDWRIAKLF
ncbi:MAG: hypothetical protein Q6352_019190 [Candidatus Freyrarchaeum guaymaensis]|nr:hypothetical protein [Candidatus Sigynarchaeota archaeon]